MGPEFMYSMRPAKKGLPARSSSVKSQYYSIVGGRGGGARTVLLEVSLAGSGELDGNELEATVLEARQDGANQATLDAIGLDSNEASTVLAGLVL
jgi:hypothetical protein